VKSELEIATKASSTAIGARLVSVQGPEFAKFNHATPASFTVEASNKKSARDRKTSQLTGRAGRDGLQGSAGSQQKGEARRDGHINCGLGQGK
jgi:hypothetical protein